jgi:hypothetical protein
MSIYAASADLKRGGQKGEKERQEKTQERIVQITEETEGKKKEDRGKTRRKKGGFSLILKSLHWNVKERKKRGSRSTKENREKDLQV